MQKRSHGEKRSGTPGAVPFFYCPGQGLSKSNCFRQLFIDFNADSGNHADTPFSSAPGKARNQNPVIGALVSANPNSVDQEVSGERE